MWRVVTATLLMTAGITAISPPAAATPSVAFDGTCTLRGEVRFSPALGVLPQETTQTARVSGICSGRLTHGGVTESVSKAPASYDAELTAPQDSCAGGTGLGAGTLTINGHQLAFDLTETRIAAIAYLNLVGTGLSEITYVQPSGGLDAVKQCAATGLEEAPVVTLIRPALL